MDSKTSLFSILTAAAITFSGSPHTPSLNDDITIPEPRYEAVLDQNDPLRTTLSIESYDEETTYHLSGKTMLTDRETHRRLAWMTYDNIPEPYHKQLLNEFEADYSDAMHDTTLSDEEYRSLPTPVRHVNLLTRLRNEVRGSPLQDDYESTNDILRAMGATIMTESFFNQDATHPQNEPMREVDVGYGQASPWVRSELHQEHGFPAPRDSSWFDVDIQVDFITTWYEAINDDETKNAVAHAAYNTGIQDARNRASIATSYYAMWYDRRQRYFTPSVPSQTQQWILDNAGLGQLSRE